MHEFGNYLGTLEFSAIPYELDEEYKAYLDTLSRDEILEEAAALKSMMNALDKMNLDH